MSTYVKYAIVVIHELWSTSTQLRSLVGTLLTALQYLIALDYLVNLAGRNRVENTCHMYIRIYIGGNIPIAQLRTICRYLIEEPSRNLMRNGADGRR